jgi:hypothetical protein
MQNFSRICPRIIDADFHIKRLEFIIDIDHSSVSHICCSGFAIPNSRYFRICNPGEWPIFLREAERLINR